MYDFNRYVQFATDTTWIWSVTVPTKMSRIQAMKSMLSYIMPVADGMNNKSSTVVVGKGRNTECARYNVQVSIKRTSTGVLNFNEFLKRTNSQSTEKNKPRPWRKQKKTFLLKNLLPVLTIFCQRATPTERIIRASTFLWGGLSFHCNFKKLPETQGQYLILSHTHARHKHIHIHVKEGHFSHLLCICGHYYYFCSTGT